MKLEDLKQPTMIVGGRSMPRFANPEEQKLRVWKAGGYEYSRCEARGLEMVGLYFAD